MSTSLWLCLTLTLGPAAFAEDEGTLEDYLEGSEDAGEAEGEPEGEPEERFLTEEEMKRLLDQLREHDEEGERMRERIRRIRRVPVKRDW